MARGRITIVNMNDGADVVVIYTRSQFQPSTPTGNTPAGWNAVASTFESNYWTLWASSAKRLSNGTIEGAWSAPIPAELYDSNALGRFPFTEGTGNQLPYVPYSSTDNKRELGLNPFGVSDVLWRGKSQISTGWCGGLSLSSSSYVPHDNAKAYRYACWFKRNTWSEGNLYFGIQGVVQAGASWADNSNYYFWYTGINTILQPDKWYLAVGYIYPSTHTDAIVDIRSGVYDAQTGIKVLTSSFYARQKAGITNYGLRIAQYNCSTTDPEVDFWQPRIDLCDGREPSIEELLKKNPLAPTVSVTGETVFKFLPGQSVPTKTSIAFSATLNNGLTTYQWQYSNGGAWTNISGATAATYSLAYNYSAWGSNAAIRLRCISTLAGTIYFSNEITITKIYDGAVGPPGVDANLLDWVADWDSAKTVIGANSVITPKIFAGVKNSNNTVTGIALGRFSMSARNDAGTIVTETIDGIYGFRDGYKTFYVDSGGNAGLGRGNQSIKYNAVTGKIEFGSEVAMAWVGATYIDANGIFTGTLSANTVNVININASQITAGTIDAARINTEALKATLITAGNINALTLSVTKGTIGGWSIDADSISRGAKNNISGAYTAASGAMTIGSTGIRGFKWRLDSTGAGAVAGGNIAWDASGNVTFASSVSLNWTTPINNITTALGGSTYPKLTQINATGIYTGSITASQITAGTISADRIAAGSIDSTKLNAESIKANIINVGYINGLTCSFVRGTIGGWTINSGTLATSQIVLDSTNKRIAVYGASSSSTTGQRTMLYYNSNSDFGFYSTDSANNVVVRLGSANQIAGWNITPTQISKNSVVLGADGSIYNGTQWKLNNDGSGQIANGNISWNASGAVTFAASVSLNWTTPINNINSALGGTSYPKLTYINSTGIYTGTLTASQVNAVDINANSITAGILSVDRLASGSITAVKLDAASIKASIINTDYINGLSCTFVRGKIGGFTIGSDNMSVGSLGTMGSTPIQIRSTNSGSGAVYAGAYKPFGITMTWHQSDNAGHLVLGQVMASGSSAKTGFIGLQMMSHDNLEYFCLSTNYTRSGSKEVYNRIAGWGFDSLNIWKNNVYLGSDGSIYNTTKWRLNNDGSGQIANGNISWNSSGTVTFSSSVSLNWTTPINNLTNALGGSSYPKLTQITSTGIYTGTLNATQITAGTISAARIDTNSIKTAILTAANINALTLTTDKGTIGGWSISATQISKNSVVLGADGSITNGTLWRLNNDGSGQLANGNISWTERGALTVSGHINATTGTIGGFNIAYDGLTSIDDVGSNYNDAYVIVRRKKTAGGYSGQALLTGYRESRIGTNVLPASSGTAGLGYFENSEYQGYYTPIQNNRYYYSWPDFLNAYPQWGDSVRNITYSGDSWINSGNYKRSITIDHNGLTVCRFNFTTTESDTYMTFELKAYSETNYDFVLIGNLDETGLTRTSNYLDRVSGNGVSKYVNVYVPTTGTHFIEFAYGKDSSQSTNGDYGLFRYISSVATWDDFKNSDKFWSFPYTYYDYWNDDNGVNELSYIIVPEYTYQWTQMPWSINRGILMDIKNAEQNLAIDVYNGSAFFRRGAVVQWSKEYIGKAYTDILESMIGRTNIFIFSSIGAATLTVRMPSTTHINRFSSGASSLVTMEFTVVVTSTTQTVQLTSQTGGQIKNNAGTNVSTLNLSYGDVATFVFVNGYWYQKQVRT